MFSDYCRPAIRLAALMGQRVIHVLTHDSIGLGEDGPTHQPVEHLAALRAIPNLHVFRPCDAIETIECWQLALEAHDAPSVLALTRQNLPQLRKDADVEQSMRGRRLRNCAGNRQGAASRCSPPVRKSRSRSRPRNFSTSVALRRGWCRCPASNCSRRNPKARAARVIGDAPVSVGIEAAIRQGWDAIIGSDGAFVGMTGFGASAPAKELYKHFGITAGEGC